MINARDLPETERIKALREYKPELRRGLAGQHPSFEEHLEARIKELERDYDERRKVN